MTKTGADLPLRHVGRLDRPSQIAIGLSQLGEFSFVLVSVLFVAGAVTAPELHAGLLAVITLSIGASAIAARMPVPGWVRGSEEAHESAAAAAT